MIWKGKEGRIRKWKWRNEKKKIKEKMEKQNTKGKIRPDHKYKSLIQT